MKIPFVIYCRAVGLYALFTIPALALPVMYLISIVYVLIYGWMAWFVFTLLHLIVVTFFSDYGVRILLLFIAVVISVAFAFHMLQVLKVEDNVWHSGSFLLFPLAAVIAGWSSVCMSGQKIRDCKIVIGQPDHTVNDLKETEIYGQ